MPTEQIETLEQFAWEGYLTPMQGVVVGVVMLAVFAFLTAREHRWTRKRVVWLFWPLRAITLVVAIWMLLGPTNQLLVRRTTPKTIAVFADASGSMQTVDPPDAVQDLRWELAAESADDPEPLAIIDRLTTAVQIATSDLASAQRRLEVGDARRRIVPDVEAARVALARADQHWKEWAEVADVGVTVDEDANGRSGDSLRANIESADQHLLEIIESTSADVFGLLQLAGEELDRAQRMAIRLARQSAQSVATTAPAVTKTVSTRQSVGSSSGVRNRRQRVADVLDGAERDWLEQLGQKVRVRRFRFGADVQAIQGRNWSEALADTTPRRSKVKSSEEVVDSSASTNLTAALVRMAELSTEEKLAAVVLISDGHHNAFNTDDDTASLLPRDQAAAMEGLPVHVVPIGSGKPPRDLILHHIDAPLAVDHKDAVVIGAVLSAYRFKDKSCTVELAQDDRVIDRQVVSIDAERGDYRVSFSTKAPAVGRHVYTLRADVLEGENDLDNNSQTAKVDVMEDKLSVLLVDGRPRWEFRYLLQLFYRDPRVEFDSLLFAPRRRGTGRLARNPQFPMTAEEWRPYRVVILGDVSPREFPRESQLALVEHVTRQGGALILVAGHQHMPQDFVGTPLEQLLPVTAYRRGSVAGGHQLLLTPEGRMEDALLLADSVTDTDRVWLDMSRRLPVNSLSIYSQPKATSHSLIEAVPVAGLQRTGFSQSPDAPAYLCWQRVGRGRVVHLAAPISYQLRYRYGDRYHHRFWGQLIRWATAADLSGGSRTVRLRTDKFRYQQGEDVEVIARLEDVQGQPVLASQPRAVVYRDGTKAATLTLQEDENIPGRYLGRFESLPPGELQVHIEGTEVDDLLRAEGVAGPITTDLTVDADVSRELVDIGSDTALLAQIAELTGGQVLPPTAIGEVFQLASLEPEVVEQSRREPLWDRWSYFGIIICCLTTEWALRKFKGLA